MSDEKQGCADKIVGSTDMLGTLCDSWYRRVVELREMGSENTLARYHLLLCISEVRALQKQYLNEVPNAKLSGPQ